MGNKLEGISTGSFVSSEIEIVEFDIEEKLESGETSSTFYGINVGKVREVIKVSGTITRSAKDHHLIEGVIDVRGEIVPVINLPKWLGKHDPQLEYARIIISEFNMIRAGFLVSHVNRIHKILPEIIEPPAAFGDREIITGVVRVQEKLIMMIDFEKVITDIDPEASASLEDVQEVEAGPKPKSVLLVEDSSTMLSMLKAAFKKAGYTVQTARNGRAALELLEQIAETASREGKPLKDYIDIITSDIDMPSMDGLTFISHLKEDPKLVEIPVVIFSSMASPENVSKWESIRADGYMMKPDVSKLIMRANEITGG